MKKPQLDKLIREEIQKVIGEGVDPLSFVNFVDNAYRHSNRIYRKEIVDILSNLLSHTNAASEAQIAIEDLGVAAGMTVGDE